MPRSDSKRLIESGFNLKSVMETPACNPDLLSDVIRSKCNPVMEMGLIWQLPGRLPEWYRQIIQLMVLVALLVQMKTSDKKSSWSSTYLAIIQNEKMQQPFAWQHINIQAFSHQYRTPEIAMRRDWSLKSKVKSQRNVLLVYTTFNLLRNNDVTSLTTKCSIMPENVHKRPFQMARQAPPTAVYRSHAWFAIGGVNAPPIFLSANHFGDVLNLGTLWIWGLFESGDFMNLGTLWIWGLYELGDVMKLGTIWIVDFLSWGLYESGDVMI